MDEYDELLKCAEQQHISRCFNNKCIYGSNPLYVYLAGKISKNDWREEIVGYRCGGLMPWDYDDLTDYSVNYECIDEENAEITNVIITGPWFLSCDHGCFHGENNHGLGTYGIGCAQEGNYTEGEVYSICLEQIERSDLVFAYIYDDTCYGTIYEIAHANAIGKQTVIIFDNEQLMSKMWFMCQGAKIVDVLDKDMSIKEKFDEIINKNIRF